MVNSELPDIPHNIPAFTLFILIYREKRPAHISLKNIVQFFSFVGFSIIWTSFRLPSSLSGILPMEQKISIISFIKASLVQKKPDMILQFLAVSERGIQAFHYILFLCSKFIWLFPVNSRKICIGQRIFFSSGSVIIPFSYRSYEANNAFPYGILCAGGSADPPA